MITSVELEQVHELVETGVCTTPGQLNWALVTIIRSICDQKEIPFLEPISPQAGTLLKAQELFVHYLLPLVHANYLTQNYAEFFRTSIELLTETELPLGAEDIVRAREWLSGAGQYDREKRTPHQTKPAKFIPMQRLYLEGLGRTQVPLCPQTHLEPLRRALAAHTTLFFVGDSLTVPEPSIYLVPNTPPGRQILHVETSFVRMDPGEKTEYLKDVFGTIYDLPQNRGHINLSLNEVEGLLTALAENFGILSFASAAAVVGETYTGKPSITLLQKLDSFSRLIQKVFSPHVHTPHNKKMVAETQVTLVRETVETTSDIAPDDSWKKEKFGEYYGHRHDLVLADWYRLSGATIRPKQA